MVKKITFTKPSYFKKTVDDKKLENIVIATGNKNQFILDENKFIVTKDFLSNTTHLLAWCYSLQSVDLSDFDFSEISKLGGWFLGCEHLTNIVFPKKVDCPNLKDLRVVFYNSGIKNLNLSNWHFSTEVDMEGMCENCFNLVELKLPQATSCSSKKLAYGCPNLKTVNFPMTLVYKEWQPNRKWLHYRMFENCTNLTLLNCEKLDIKHDFYDSQKTIELSIKNTPEDLIIILPNKNMKTTTLSDLSI